MKTISSIGLVLLSLATVTGNTASAGGDASKGKEVFNKCKACHSLKVGRNKSGPSLARIYGKTAGTVEGYRYKGLKGADWIWDEANLDGWIENPKKWLKAKMGKKWPKSKMSYKLKNTKKDPRRRADLIEYLKTLVVEEK